MAASDEMFLERMVDILARAGSEAEKRQFLGLSCLIEMARLQANDELVVRFGAHTEQLQKLKELAAASDVPSHISGE